MVLVIGQNSSWQTTCVLPRLEIGKVNRADTVVKSAAGKGANMVRGLMTLGVPGRLLGYAGGGIGERFVRACEEEGLPATFVPVHEETRVCTSLVLPNGETTEVIEPAPATNAQERRGFDEAFQELITDASLLAIGGTALQGEPEDTYYRFIQTAKNMGIPVFLDSYRIHGQRALAASPDVLKINADELADLTKTNLESVEQRSAACRAIRDRYGVKWVIITRGRGGAEAFAETGMLYGSAPDVSVLNPIGSGDAFAAGVIAALYKNGIQRAGLRDAVKIGISMGTANCMSLKPGYVDPQDREHVMGRVALTESTNPS
jgi:tagatose 6-phosphate kinase